MATTTDTKDQTGTTDTNDKKKCPDLPTYEPPGMPDDKKCPQPCCCPPPPGGGDKDCFVKALEAQGKIVKEAETASKVVEELTTIQKDAASAREKYTPQKYADLVSAWWDEDKSIADLIHNVVCNVNCWECLIQCRLCPLLYEIGNLERQLYGTGTFPTRVDSLQEKKCWFERKRDDWQRISTGIKNVLDAWKDPYQTIFDNLKKNKDLIGEVKDDVSKDHPAAVFKLFARIIPLHWAMRPEGVVPYPDPPPTTRDPKQSAIKAVYIDLCTCDDPKPEECCGPNTAPLSVRQRLTGAQPYLVDPNKLIDVICCVATERYIPAKQRLAKAEADLASTVAEIARTQELIDSKSKIDAIQKAFTADLTTPIDCSKYWKKASENDPCDKPPQPQQPPRAAC